MQFLREFAAATDFFCNSHVWCFLFVLGGGLENIFCNFYEMNSSQEFFLYCENVGVDGSAFSNLKALALLTSSLLISDFWVFLSFPSDRSVFVPSGRCAEDAATAGEIKRKPEILAN